MRKLLFFPVVFLALNAFGQAPPPPAQQQMPPAMAPERPDFIIPLQMGTDTLKKGQVTVTLTEQSIAEMKQAQANPNYTVILTPRGDCGALNLVSTNATNFVVKEPKGSSSGIFDYVVFVKQKRPMMPAHPQRPNVPLMPGQPGQPNQPGQPTPPAAPQH